MASFKAFFKRNFLTGLIVSIPAIITYVVVVWFFNSVDQFMAPVYDKIIGRHIPGIGLSSAILLIFIIGIISRNVIGKWLILNLENLFLKLPLFKGLYNSIRQVVDAFSPEKSDTSFQRFVLVEYPRKGVYSFGFQTRECRVRGLDCDLPLKSVYIPTNNLYMGEIVLFRDDSIIPTGIPVDEGIKIILSGGLAIPNEITGECK